MNWTIFCPGPSLNQLKKDKVLALVTNAGYQAEYSIAVNGAILNGFPVKHWVMLDYKVFLSCFNSFSPVGFEALARGTGLWIPNRQLMQVDKAFPLAGEFLRRFAFKTWPKGQLGGLMPFAKDFLWDDYSFFCALAIAVMYKAKTIKIYGADMTGEGYFKKGLENKRTSHNTRRWTDEKYKFDCIVSECDKHGIEITREFFEGQG